MRNRACYLILKSIPLLAAVTILLLGRPYSGIRHDAILYIGQALEAIHPENFKKDLFFVGGSQASYTVFPKLISYLLVYFSAGSVAKAGVLIGFLLFILASCFLLRKLMPGNVANYALVCLVVWPSAYGAQNIFKYLEPYFTARSLVEPLVLAALGLGIAKKFTAAFILLLVGATLHPLQALPGLIVWFFIASSNWSARRKLNISVLICAIACLLVAWGAGPFSSPLARYDEAWWNAIRIANQSVFLQKWPLAAFITVGVDIITLNFALRHASESLKLYIKAVLLAAAICFAAAFLLSDIFHLVLFSGLQLWRVHWLLHWSAVALLPVAATGLWMYEASPRVKILLLTCTWILSASIAGMSASYAAIFTALLLLLWDKIPKQHLRPWYQSIFVAALVIALIGSYAKYLAYIFRFRPTGVRASEADLLIAAFSYPLPLMLFSAALLWVWKKGPYPSRLALMLLLWGALIFTVYRWDQRSTYDRNIERYADEQSHSLFNTSIPAGSGVYWDDGTLETWLVLKSSSYWNIEQESGLLFNRITAMTAVQRRTALQEVEIQLQICRAFSSFTGDTDRCYPDADTLKNLCVQARSAIDYFVLKNNIPGLVPFAKWHVEVKGIPAGLDYYMYQCRQ